MVTVIAGTQSEGGFADEPAVVAAARTTRISARALAAAVRTVFGPLTPAERASFSARLDHLDENVTHDHGAFDR